MSETVNARGYRQVAAVLRERVESQTYPVGSQLPTEVLLIEEFGVARDTVRRAIALLAEDGLVVTSHGRGTFVSDGRHEEIGLSKHAQVAAELRALIESGEPQAGTAFLTEAEIQGRFAVSRRTARAALKGLEEAGLLQVVGRRRLVVGQGPTAGRPNSK